MWEYPCYTRSLKILCKGKSVCDHWYRYLVGVIKEMHWDTEGQRVVVRVPQQDRQDLHARGAGLSLPFLLAALYRPLTVDGILPNFCPEEDGGVYSQNL